MRRVHVLLLLAVVSGLIVTLSSPANAQSIWIDREGKSAVLLEFLRPSVDNVDADPLTAAMFLSGRVALSPVLSLVGQVPYARHSAQRTYYVYATGDITSDVTEGMVGNVYLGIEGTPRSGPVFGEVGVRLPAASETKPFAASTGILADVRRAQAFFANTVCLETAVNVASGQGSKVNYRLRFSPVIEFDTNESQARGRFNYSLQAGYRGSVVRTGAALSGRTALAATYASIALGARNQLELHADFLSGAVRPGIDVKVPLGSWSYGVGTVVGASLMWTR